MTYKETLFFIGKCLTITHEEHNRVLVEKELKSGNVDWDNVVKVSTSHYVFPALYCNLKRVNFLKYLPNDLVEYMKHITDLNRERNQQIIEQAKEINSLLFKKNITPIFLKGTGNLLENLYEDIAERMVGDIDFIVSKKEYQKTIHLLKDLKYKPVNKSSYQFPSYKHYPRLCHMDKIAAIEIHKEMVMEKYSHEFNYNLIIKSIQRLNNIFVLSFKYQLTLSIIAKQINDNGQFLKDISLRNTYDVFLLSKKINSLEALYNFNKLFEPLNNFLSITNKVLNTPCINFDDNDASKDYNNQFENLLNNNTLRKKFTKRIKKQLFIKERIEILKKATYSKAHRKWLFKRIRDKNWILPKLGFKPNS